MGPITDAHRLAYQANIELAVQQKRSKLDMAFTYHSGLSGRIATILELIGETNAVEDLGRKADTPDIDNTLEDIWIVPHQIAWGKLIEREDHIKALTDFQSQFVQAGAAGMVRRKDTRLAASVFAARKIGQDGTATAAWAGKTVTTGIGSADDVTLTGMNVKKIIRARRYLAEDQVDTGQEQLFLGLDALGVEELFRDLTFINADYRDRKVLDAPERVDILGVTILPPLDGAAAFANYDGGTRTAALWCKSGMHWGEFDPIRTAVPLRPDKLNRPHPQMEQWLGATRSEDKKVVKILNKIPA